MRTASRRAPFVALAADPPEIDTLIHLLRTHRRILDRLRFVAPDEVAHALLAELGLPVELLYQSPMWDGLSSRIENRRVDAVVFIRDPHGPSEQSISIARACDMLRIPLATNVGTAEVVLHFLADMIPYRAVDRSR